VIAAAGAPGYARHRGFILEKPYALTRRDALRLLAVLGVTPLTACVGGSSETDDEPLDSDAIETGDTDATETGDTDAPPLAWATGGTGGMTGKDEYPDPFGDVPTACAAVATTTAGPCTTATDLVRSDISEGWRGLPVRLLLRFVGPDCAPAAGVTVRVWHTNVEGSYSGETPNNPMCLQDEAYASTDFFRGVQVTDDRGVVGFDTCFPGAYPGRAVHLHFQIVRGDRSSHVSQLFFLDTLTTDIFSSHPDYAPFGQPTTTLANDGISRAIPAAELARLTLTTARMDDGALLASQTLVVD
jgi:protocatechuate 3,4-dioxygenase beta subunit